MGNCKFLDELNRLRKSSSDSIDNTETFDDFKQYMHVTRTAEEDLKDILRKVNASNKKTLVLLCGNAGDGKSHLLSYLKNSDEEHLIEDYIIYNDATESNAPSKTAIETLNELLEKFKDKQLENIGKNAILAINLGVLSNFIESKYGDEFSILRKYVEDNNILTTQINKKYFDEHGHFQHVSFSDYHMYSLTKNGIHAKYIEDIFKKIFSQNEENRFYQSYLFDCGQCPLSKKCPVKMNYEFLMEEKRQRYTVELLVETVIKDKVILTTREILNFIYNIMVSQNFSFTSIQKSLDDSAYLKKFLRQITPSLLFDSMDVTALMNILNKYDPLRMRSEKADESAISYYVSSDISKEIEKRFKDIPFGRILCESSMVEKINTDKLIKSELYKLMVRVDAFNSNDMGDKVYKNYLKDLFLYNAGIGKELGNLYGMVENALAQWCGSDEDGNLCLDDRHTDFSLYEAIEFSENLDDLPQPTDETELHRFIPYVIVSFDGNDGDTIHLDIDYSLYELLSKLNLGYIQTANDRNNHADFISFAKRMLQTGQLTKSVSVLSQVGKKATISAGKFGYKFKVVK